MPMFCCVVGCHSKGGRDDVKFYSLPVGRSFKHALEVNFLTKLRREKWLSEINRIDWTEKKLKRAMVCSRHFISGKPAALRDVTDPDWIPCQNLSPINGPRRKGIRNKGLPPELTMQYEPKIVKKRGGRSCAVAFCRNTTTNALNRGISLRFHHFPQDLAVQKKWTKYCHRDDKINIKYATICSEHFTNADYADAIMAKVMGTQPFKLKKGAVPSFKLLHSKQIDQYAVQRDEDLVNEEKLKQISVPENVTRSLRERINRCYLCLTRDRQFFHVPRDPDIRKTWAKSLSSTTVFPLKKTVLLCEDHFEKSNVVEDDHGNKSLKLNTLPVYLDIDKIIEERGESEAEREFFENFDSSGDDSIDNKCRQIQFHLVRCSVCFDQLLEKDAIALVQNENYTQFGSILLTILNVGCTEISTGYCCVTCSKQALNCFEALVELNVSAFLSFRRKTNDNILDILQKGCDECGAELVSIESLSDHFMDHILTKNTLNGVNMANIEGTDTFILNDEKENKVIKKKRRKKRLSGPIKKCVKTSNLTSLIRTYDGIDDEKCMTEHSYGKEPKKLPFACDLCDTVSSDKRKYLKHQWFHKRYPNYNYKKKGEKQSNAVKNTLYNCEKCDAEFNKRSLLFYHCVMVHEIPIPDHFSSRQQPWHCSACNKRFTTMEKLKTHGNRKHNGKNIVRFQCELCKLRCLSICGLRRHVKSKHDKPDSYSCDKCSKHFQRKDFYIKHMNNIHGIDSNDLDSLKCLEKSDVNESDNTVLEDVDSPEYLEEYQLEVLLTEDA